jgi:hypothetical protein
MLARTLALTLIVTPCVCLAQAPAPPRATPVPPPAREAAAAPQPAAAATPLPVRRVILYKTGVGYFEHLGRVRNRQDVTIRFTSAQLNDALKSLTTIDLGQGQITGISYNSVAPLEQRLGALRLPLGDKASSASLLGALRGARVEVTSGSTTVAGRLLSVERSTRGTGADRIEVQGVAIVTDAGDVRTYDLTPAVHIRIVERDLRQEIDRYLDVVGSSREQDVRSLSISTTGQGERSLFVSYISEVPIWKSTYRLVLPTGAAKPLLQGWAIIDNTIGEDWTNVELSLVAGAPQSFIQNLSQPYYGHRSVMPMPENVQLSPQTHEATLLSGTGTVAGQIRDETGSALPGARVFLDGPKGTVATAVTDDDGSYSIEASDGDYRLRVELSGFRTRVDEVRINAGTERRMDGVLPIDGLNETVAVSAETPKTRGMGLAGGVAGGAPNMAAPAPPPPLAAPAMPLDAYEQARQADAAAAGASLGDLFEYRLKQPVTLAKNQSALVPIVNSEITAEKVALWTGDRAGGAPLRAVWITNGSGLTLDGGSMSIVDSNAFAGEGLIEPLKPGERRLVSYAAELGMRMKQERGDAPGRVVRVRAQQGVIVQESEQRASWTYTARNENDAPTTVVIEHHLRPGWKLVEGQTAAESTLNTHRFRLVVEPKKDATLVVREVRVEQTRIALAGLTDTWMTQVTRAGVSGADLQRVLKPVIDKRAELATLDRRLNDLQMELQTITADQQRLRENMKALRGSTEEKQLLQRYTHQLDAQETRLDALKSDMTKASDARTTSQMELASLISTLNFDLSGGQ